MKQDKIKADVDFLQERSIIKIRDNIFIKERVKT